MRRLICVLLCGALLYLSGCGDWDEVAQGDPLGELSQYYQTENEPGAEAALTSFTLPWYADQTLDPLTCPDGCQQTVGALLYEGLYELGPDFAPRPVLAAEAFYDSDTHVYTIRLRNGIHFSDGAPLTAQDVASSLQRARHTDRYGARLQQVADISHDGSDLIITLTGPNGGFLSLLDIPVVESGTENEAVPVGTGPYVMARDAAGERCLARDPQWWQGKTMPLERISLLECRSSDAVNYAFASRDVQLLCCDLTGTAALPSDIRGDYTDASTAILQYLGFRMDHELLSQEAVRQAISLAVNRDIIASNYMLGHGTAALFPVHPADPAYPAALEEPVTRDSMDEAMAGAGLSGGEEPIPLLLLVNSENSFKVATAEEIARALNRYDLEVSVTALPWEEYLTALLEGEFDLYYGECRMTADWDMEALIGTEGALNLGGFSDEAADELLLAYRAATGNQRAEALYRLCQYLRSQCPIVPLCFKSTTVLVTHDAVDAITPTAANPFYGMAQWTVHLETEKTEP